MTVASPRQRHGVRTYGAAHVAIILLLAPFAVAEDAYPQAPLLAEGAFTTGPAPLTTGPAHLTSGPAHLTSGPAPLTSGPISLRAAGGVTFPAGLTSKVFGPVALVAVEASLVTAISLRVDGEVWWVGTQEPAGRHTCVAGASVNGILHLWDHIVSPYLVAGAGYYRVRSSRGGPEGYTPTLQVGLGLDADLARRVNPFLEVRVTHQLSDPTHPDGPSSVYWPVVVGARVSLP
jgi:hypothetical protein